MVDIIYNPSLQTSTISTSKTTHFDMVKIIIKPFLLTSSQTHKKVGATLKKSKISLLQHSSGLYYTSDRAWSLQMKYDPLAA